MWNFDEAIDREGTNCIKYDLREDSFGRKDIIPMWVADMDFKTPEFIVSALKDRLDHQIYGYTYRPKEYYNSIIGWHEKRHNWKIEKGWISFTPGVVPALNICTLAFTKPGDSIIVQPPVYFPFFSAVESHGRKLIYNQLVQSENGWSMDFDSLEKSVAGNARMIIISNPHNPIGRSWSASELTRLAEICIKNKIIILSDEIHCDLVLPGFRHTPVASLSKEIADNTITCIAPSKTFNLAGLSTSSVIIPNPELKKAYSEIIENLHIGNGNIFGAVASIAAYTNGHEWLDSLLDYIKGNIDYTIEYFRKMIPEIIPVAPEATYMIWLDCKQLCMNEKELMEFFVHSAGVEMNEGSTFGPGGKGYMRMNVALTRKTLTRALKQIEIAVSKIR